MTQYYSKATGEHIATDNPADWMGRTEKPVPVYDAASASAIFNAALDDWEIVTATPPEVVVPREVAMRQARLALLAAGILPNVAIAIAALPSPQKEAAQIEWEYSQTVERNRPFVLSLGSALGLDAAALDTLFLTAAAL